MTRMLGQRRHADCPLAAAATKVLLFRPGRPDVEGMSAPDLE